MAPQQRILQGDCLDVFSGERGIPAFVSDPPGLVGYNGFMGRSWDTAHESFGGFAPMLPPRDRQHARELEHDYNFTQYWAIRYAMAYDVADQHAFNVVWTLPRTSHLTAAALRAAGWTIRDNLLHLFGTGWAKKNNLLAPGYEGWLLCTKGKPEMDVDACRVPRGGPVPMPGVKIRASRHFDGSESNYEMVDPPPGNPLGSLPKNALLSHCEECVQVGVKRVKASAPASGPTLTGPSSSVSRGKFNGVASTPSYGGATGTEAVGTWYCLAGCVCGASAEWPDDRPLPQCPCGEVWRWLCPVAEVDAQGRARGVHSAGSAQAAPSKWPLKKGICYGEQTGAPSGARFGDTDLGSSSARFFNNFAYIAKCPASEKHAGCEELYWRANRHNPFGFDRISREEWETLPTDPAGGRSRGNVHPTVKSLALMRWLHRLTGARQIGDLCGGSGSAAVAAYLDGVDWIGAELCPEAVEIAQARLTFWRGLTPQQVGQYCSGKSLREVAAVSATVEPTRTVLLEDDGF